MKTKIVENYIYEGLGFPILLPTVEMIYFQNDWHYKVDVYGVADMALKALVTQESRLTGNQVRFARTYLSMPLRKFAKEVVHESHAAVSKWEKFGDKITNMDGNIEAMLRLYIYDRVCAKTIKQKNEFYEKYQEIKKLFLNNKSPKFMKIALD